MSRCPECGAEFGRYERYCSECGVELPRSDADTDLVHRDRRGDPRGDHPRSDQGIDRGSTAQRERDSTRHDAPGQNRRRSEPGPAHRRDEPPSTAEARFRTGQKLAGVGAGLIAIGAFLPWVSAQVLGTTVSVSGVEGGDGIITLSLGLVAGIGGLVRWGRWAKLAVAAVGVLIAGLGVLYAADPLLGVENVDPATRAAFSPSIGVFVTILGGGSLIVATLWNRVA